MLPMGWTHHGNDEVHSHEVCSVNSGETPFLPECVKHDHVSPEYMRAGRQDNGKVTGIDETKRQVAIGTGITPTSKLVMFEKCLVAIRAWLGPRSECYDHFNDGNRVADPWGYIITVPNGALESNGNDPRTWTKGKDDGSVDAAAHKQRWADCRGNSGSRTATMIPGLWPLLRACKAPRDATEASGAINGDCGTKQANFEEAHCNYYQLVGYHCYEVGQCVATEVAACGETNYAVTGEGSGAGGADKLISDWQGTGFTDDNSDITTSSAKGSGTCGDIQKRVEQRQSDNETMEHIDCLLAALIAATQGDPGTATEFNNGANADLTFTSANGAEQNQNSLRNKYRCTATFNTVITGSSAAATEGAECVCDGVEAYTQSELDADSTLDLDHKKRRRLRSGRRGCESVRLHGI